MPRKLVMPAIASGILWGVAQVAWFQANLDARPDISCTSMDFDGFSKDLGFSVAFPVIASLPGVIGLLG